MCVVCVRICIYIKNSLRDEGYRIKPMLRKKYNLHGKNKIQIAREKSCCCFSSFFFCMYAVYVRVCVCVCDGWMCICAVLKRELCLSRFHCFGWSIVFVFATTHHRQIHHHQHQRCRPHRMSHIILKPSTYPNKKQHNKIAILFIFVFRRCIVV